MARRKLILDDSSSSEDYQSIFDVYVPRDKEEFTQKQELNPRIEDDLASSDHTPSPKHKLCISDEDEEAEKEEDEEVVGTDRNPSLSDDDIVEDEWYGYGSNKDSFRVRQRETEQKTEQKQRKTGEKQRRKKRKVVLGSDQENGGEEGNNKKSTVNNKSGTNRLWSEEDEIAILKGMLSYQAEGGDIAHVSANIGSFHGFLRSFLRVGVSDTQLKDKIKRMKKKYKNNAAKVESIEGPIFNKKHEEEMFGLSEMVWGSRKSGRASRKALPLRGGEVESGLKTVDFWSMYPRVKEAMEMEEFGKISAPESGKSFVLDKLRSLRMEEMMELENKWRELQKAEIQVSLMRTEVVQAQTKLIMKVLK